MWQVGADRYLVDEDGLLFARGRRDARPRPRPSCRSSTTSAWPPAALASAATLDPVLLDAARRLGSLRPADLGTAASRLEITARRRGGFTLTAEPVGWSAVFGFYTPTLRTTELIPGQVRLLRSMLAGREETCCA